MYCSKCGKALPNGVKFCTRCGTPISTIAKNSNVSSNCNNDGKNRVCFANSTRDNKRNNTFLYVTVAGVVLVVSILALWIIFSGKDDEQASKNNSIGSKEYDFSQVNEANTTSQNTDSQKANNKKDQQPSVVPDKDVNNRDILYEFGISSSTVEDYSKNLDPDKYLYYSAGIGEMSFSYPANLFNNVEVNDNSEETKYGENIKTIVFYGNRGSELAYSVYKRIDGGSIKAATSRINNIEHNKYTIVSDLVVSSDDNHGRIVLAGTTDSSESCYVYDLIKIDDNYVYRMTSLKPKYKDEEEKNQYAYVTENIYRMCDFSGSTKKPRSYREYMEGNQ